MRLAPFSIAEARRGSRAAEATPVPLGPRVCARSATAAGAGGKPGSSWRPLACAPVTGKPGGGGAWSAEGAAGRGSVTLGHGRPGFHPGCREREGGERASCLMKDPEAKKETLSLSLSPLKRKLLCKCPGGFISPPAASLAFSSPGAGKTEWTSSDTAFTPLLGEARAAAA